MKSLLTIKSLLGLKTVLMSVMVMAVVGGLIGSGLFAYFSDTETSTNNTFTAGTIDIAVDGENPWSESYYMEVKPCEVGIIDFEVQNVGTNAVDVWKHIYVTDVYGGEPMYPPAAPFVSSEPELEAEGGVWTNVHANVDPMTCDLELNGQWVPDGIYPVPSIDPPIPDAFTCECLLGGMYIEGMCQIFPPGACVDTDVWDWSDICWEPYDYIFDETVYDIYSDACWIEEEYGVYLYDIAGYGPYPGYWLYLGQIGPQDYMEVHQSYHLLDYGEPQNYFQGDTIIFDIELYAQQTTGGEFGEGPPPPGPEWFMCSKSGQR